VVRKQVHEDRADCVPRRGVELRRSSDYQESGVLPALGRASMGQSAHGEEETPLIPLTPRVREMLIRRLRDRESISGLLFPERWTNGTVGRTFNNVLTKEGMDGTDHRGEKLVTHGLRHYYATTLVVNGADAASVRDLLGHSSITVTDRYFNIPRSELFRSVGQAFDDETKNVTKNVTTRGVVERFSAYKRQEASENQKANMQ